MSQDYAKTIGTSKYFHLDTTGTMAMAHWMAQNRGFLDRHSLITGASEVYQ